ncbi:hypothetical protein AAG747_02285 [Rapidithrix thailandica]|uniref:Uncharacterized protein n=1 Tax=Rapidithrix thailandica TaxID=413964 RepID=A0AAW9S2V0_9BACT
MKNVKLIVYITCLSLLSFSSYSQDASESDKKTETTTQQTQVDTQKKTSTPKKKRTVQKKQEDEEPTAFGSLDDHFKYLKDKSNNYETYKVIKKNRLESFWNVVTDSVHELKGKLDEANQKIVAQQSNIEQLNGNLKTRDQALEESNYYSDHIKVIGIDFSKGSYITMNFVVIIVLIAAVGVIFYRFRDANMVATEKRKEYDDIVENFEEYKKQAREKQIKLKRDLQTELNTVEELKQEITALKNKMLT